MLGQLMTTFKTLSAASADQKSEPADRAGNDASCDACSHSWEGHDAIEARYCAATAEFSLARGCICEYSDHKPAGSEAAPPNRTPVHVAGRP